MSRPIPDHFSKAVQAGNALRAGETVVSALLEGAQKSALAFGEILPRYNAPTRPVDPANVIGLAESIAELGLIGPITVDTQHRLLAGGHRLSAFQLLTAVPEQREWQWAEMFPEVGVKGGIERLQALPVWRDPIPVHILDFDSAADPATAIAVEIAENEKRRNYTAEEVQSLASSLRGAGYRASSGKPKPGERLLMPTLTAMLGKSERTVYRMLSDTTDPPPPNGRIPAASPTGEGGQDGRLLKAAKKWLETRGPNMIDHPVRAAVEVILREFGSERNS